MTLKTAQLIIINQLFLRHSGRRQDPSKDRGDRDTRSQVDSAPEMAPANVARQAWRLLLQQGLIDGRGRLTLSGLAVAVALRARARRSAREATAERKTPGRAARSGGAVTALRRMLLAA